MSKKATELLYKGSFSSSVIAFLLLGYLLGMLGDGKKSTIMVTIFFIILLLAIRVYVLLVKKDRETLFMQFYQWMFEASVVFWFAAFQQEKAVLYASLLIFAVIIQLVLLLIAFSKLIH